MATVATAAGRAAVSLSSSASSLAARLVRPRVWVFSCAIPEVGRRQSGIRGTLMMFFAVSSTDPDLNNARSREFLRRLRAARGARTACFKACSSHPG